MLNNGTPTDRQLTEAALLYSGAGAVLTGLAACRRHGIRRGPIHGVGALHLLVPHERRRRSANFAVVERTHRMPEPVTRDNVPLAPVARACIDAARRLPDARGITELLGDAVQRGLCTVADLRSEIRLCSSRGRALPRIALDAVGDGIRSAAERDARLLWRTTGLPAAWWNASVYDSAGRLLGVVDAWCDDVALAWEINSVEFHIGPADYARTTERAARFAAAGVVIVPTLPSRIRRSPAQVVAELRAAYQAASNRPRPALHAVSAAA